MFKHGRLNNQESVSADKEESKTWVPDFLAEKNGMNINVQQFLLTSESSEEKRLEN